MTDIVIRVTDAKNRTAAFIDAVRGSCTLADGTPASLAYAGVDSDNAAEVAIRLRRCETMDEALIVLERFGSPRYTYAAF